MVTRHGRETIYYVYGWAGVILAKQADGKKAEASGVVSEQNGMQTIVGKSIDVKIILFEENRNE